MTVEKDQRNASKSPILNIEYEDEQVRTEIPAILDTSAQLSIEYLVQLYVLIQERNNILFGNDIIKLLKLTIITIKTQLYRVVQINQSR